MISISDKIILVNDLVDLIQKFAPIDSHFHHFSCLEKDIGADEQLKFAFENGLHAAIDAGNPEYSFSKRKLLAESYPRLFLLSGYHPENCHNDHALNINSLKEELLYEKTIALGEVGLDYTYPIAHDIQQKCLSLQLELAKQVNKPVVLHIRDAHDDALAIIREHKVSNGIVHCFTGNNNQAKKWIDQGFYLSFSGILTFKNSEQVQKSALYTPLEQLFCETDAPYLTPVPFRGEINQIGFVAYIYEYMANLKKISAEILSSTLINNLSNFMHQGY